MLHHPLTSRGSSTSARPLQPLSIPASSSHEYQHLSPTIANLHIISAVAASHPVSSEQLPAPSLTRQTPVSAARLPLPQSPRVRWVRLQLPPHETQTQAEAGENTFEESSSNLTAAFELLRDLHTIRTADGESDDTHQTGRGSALGNLVSNPFGVLDFGEDGQAGTQSGAQPITGKRKARDDDADASTSHDEPPAAAQSSFSQSLSASNHSTPHHLWVFKIQAAEDSHDGMLWKVQDRPNGGSPSDDAQKERRALLYEAEQALNNLHVVEKGDYLLSSLFGTSITPRCEALGVITRAHAWLQHAIEQTAADVFVSQREARIKAKILDRGPSNEQRPFAAVPPPPSSLPVSSDTEEGEVVEADVAATSPDRAAGLGSYLLDHSKQPLRSATRFGAGVLLLPPKPRAETSAWHTRRSRKSNAEQVVYFTIRAHMSTESLILQILPTKRALVSLDRLAADADRLVGGDDILIAPSGRLVRYLMRADEAGMSDDDLKLFQSDPSPPSDNSAWALLSDNLLSYIRQAGLDEDHVKSLTASDWAVCAPLSDTAMTTGITDPYIASDRTMAMASLPPGHSSSGDAGEDDSDGDDDQAYLPEHAFLWPACLSFFAAGDELRSQLIPGASKPSLLSRLGPHPSDRKNTTEVPEEVVDLPGLHYTPLQDLTQRTVDLLRKLAAPPPTPNPQPIPGRAIGGTPASPVHTPAMHAAIDSATLAAAQVTPQTLIDPDNVDKEGNDDDDDLWGGSHIADTPPQVEDGPPVVASDASSAALEEQISDPTVAQFLAAAQNVQSPLPDDEDDDFAGIVTENDFDFFDDDAFGVLGEMQVDMSGAGDAPGGDDDLGGLLDTSEDMPMGPPDITSGHLGQSYDFGVPITVGNALPISSDSGPSMDPPSLPGFTPSSLTASASSPLAHNGGNNYAAKTPRTPFSPYEDNSMEPIIAGDDPRSVYRGVLAHRYGDHTGFSPADGIVRAEPPENSFHNDLSGGAEKQDRSGSALYHRDLGSKYDLGKFATPGGREDAASLLGPSGPGGRMGRGSRQRDAHSGIALSLPQLHKLRLEGTDDPIRQRGKAILGPEGEADSDGSQYDDDDAESDSESDDDSEADEGAAVKALLVRNACSILDSLKASPCRPVWSDRNATSSARTLPGREEREAEQEALDVQVQYIARNPLLHPWKRRSTSMGIQAHINVSASEVIDVVGGLRDLAVHSGPSSSTTSTSTCSLDPILGVSGLLERLEPPAIMVGCQDTVVRMAPSALAFWDKLALAPIGGQKNVIAFIMHPPLTPSWSSLLRGWQGRVQSAFESYGLGVHKLHVNGMLEMDAGGKENVDLMPILRTMSKDPERWSDTLRSAMDRMRTSLRIDRHVVLYIMGSPVNGHELLHRMQSELRSLAHSTLGVSSDHLVVQAIPWTSTTEASDLSLSSILRPANGTGSAPPYSNMRRFVFNLYEGLSRVILRQNLRIFHEDLRPKAQLVQYPAFTLAPPNPDQGSLADFEVYRLPSSSLPALSVVHRGMLLNVAYKLSEKHIYMSAIDVCGQAHAVQGSFRQETLLKDLMLVAAFAREMARRANILWRLVICKVGAMHTDELYTWHKLAANGAWVEVPSLDVTLLCADIEVPLAILPSRHIHQGGTTPAVPDTTASTPSAVLVPTVKRSVLVNASTASYALYPQDRMRLDDHTFKNIVDGSAGTASSSPMLPLCSSMIVCVPRHTDLSFAPPGRDMATDGAPLYAYASHVLGLNVLKVWDDSRTSGVRQARSKTETDSSSSTSLAARLRDITRSFSSLRLLTTERDGISLETHGVAARLPWHLAILCVVDCAIDC